jgi:hypothetical protein
MPRWPRIAIDHRPVRAPHYGGHIERLIGTMMGKVHLLPGTTELRGKVGDGVNQAADLISATASIPSLNFIPLTTFGKWF